MVTLTHPFVSGKADGTDVTLVKPTNWNAEHKFETAADDVLLGRATGAGPGAVQEIPFTAVFPAGMIMPYAGTGTPNGWLRCDGQSLIRVDYAALFTAIGSTYGSVDATHFNVPDLRGRTPAGVDGGAGRLPSWVLGTAGGGSTSSTGTFSMGAVNNLNYGNVALAGAYAQYPSSSSGVQGGGGVVVPDAGATWSILGGYTPINANFNISVSGASGAFSIVQPTIAINYLIKT